CPLSVTPPRITLPASGGRAFIGYSALAGCATLVSQVSTGWLGFMRGPGEVAGSGTVTVTAGANAFTQDRSGSISIVTSTDSASVAVVKARAESSEASPRTSNVTATFNPNAVPATPPNDEIVGCG